MVKGFPSLLVLVLVASFVPSAALAQALEPYEVMRALRGRDGADSQSGLVRGADDLLYGTATTGGGPNGAGTIFRITTGGVFDVVYRFLTTAPENGINPVSLMRGRDNHLYGTTDYGGRLSSGATVDADGNPVGDGIIYRLNWNATTLTYSGITVLHTFDCSAGDGGDPWGTLVEGPDGALYGMTIPSWRPDPDCTDVSTVFKLNKDGTGFEVLARFDYLDTGSNQFGPLAFGSDGSIFGTLTDSVNTEYQFGSIFKIAPDGTVSYPKIFEGADGAFPFSGVVRGVDGAFYGTTLAGGSYDAGTIFRIEEDGDFASLYSFDPSSIHTPYSPVVVGGDGTLYGAAHAGGGSPGCGLDAAGNPYGCGGTYVFDPPSPIGSGAGFSLHSTFDHTTTGSSPWGPLGVGADRHLYGTQSAGGSGSQGTLFGLLNIEVADRPPVPFAMVSPNPAEALTPQGATVSLNALGSWDADFDSLTYAWILPDAAIPVSGDPAAAPVISATFPEGTWLVGLNVTAGGATSSLTIPVTVIDEPPVFGAVSPVSAPATLLSSGEIGAIVDYPLPAANDRVDGDRSAYVECLPASGLAFLLGSTTVECSVSDTRGHVATTSFVVTVTPAVTLNVPANQTIEAAGASGAAFTFTVSATSAAGATLTPVCSHESGR